MGGAEPDLTYVTKVPQAPRVLVWGSKFLSLLPLVLLIETRLRRFPVRHQPGELPENTLNISCRYIRTYTHVYIHTFMHAKWHFLCISNISKMKH